MAFGLFDRVWDGSTTTGSGPIELTGVSPLGFRPFNSKMSVGDTTYVCVSSQALTEWCTALGTFTAANEITLGTIFDSSNGGAAVSFSAGQKDVYIVEPAAATGAIQIGVTPANGTAKGFLFTDGSFVQAFPAWNDTSNISIGSALPSLTVGNSNTSFGTNALKSITSGSNNLALGINSLYKNTIGSGNIAAGPNSLFANTSGNYNVGFGSSILGSNISGSYNVAFGYNALSSNVGGSYNFAVGLQSLAFNTSGNFNIGIGFITLYSNTTGNNNIGIGYEALLNSISGGNNTAIGSSTGGGITTGSNNTIIGSGVTGLPAALTGAVILATGDGTIQLDYNKTNPGAWTFPTPPILPTYTIAQLLAIASPVAGMQAFVSDTVALAAPTWHGAVTGGGSITVAAPVFYAAGAWKYT
jgi:hypothetical protein